MRMITQAGDLKPSSYTSGGNEKILVYGRCWEVNLFAHILQVGLQVATEIGKVSEYDGGAFLSGRSPLAPAAQITLNSARRLV